MTDHLTPERRSWNMGRIRSRNTGPEVRVRSLLHAMGYRFRLQGRVGRGLHPNGCLPGKPDIVLAKYRTVVFVHGCFWHRHPGCRFATTPGTRTEWWLAKFSRNQQRDREIRDRLTALDWRVVVVWECELRAPEALAQRLRAEIGTASGSARESMGDQLETLPMVAEPAAVYRSGGTADT